MQLFEISAFGQQCFMVDCLAKVTIEEFRQLYRSIFVAYAFLFGRYNVEKGMILSYKSLKMENPDSLLYYTCGLGYGVGFPIHTSNYVPYIKSKPIKDEHGRVIGVDSSAGKKLGLQPFPEADFDKLCNLIHSRKGINRALDLYISTFGAPVENAVPTYFVILEHITFSLSGKSEKRPLIVNDPALVATLKSLQDGMVKEIESLKKDCLRRHPEDKTNIKTDFDRIKVAVRNINRGSNNQKLIGLFEKYGYTLSLEEKELFQKTRNLFLHGDEVIVNPDMDINVLHYYCMKLQKLMAILILKEIGYKGYIVNNAKAHENSTRKKLRKDVFIKI